MSNERDTLLRERLVGGDDRALSDIYDEHGPTVFGLAVRITGDRCAAEDVTQEVFLWLWEHPEQYLPERGGLRSWLCIIARRRAIDHLRRAAAEDRRAAAQARQPAPATGFEDLVVLDAIAKTVRNAVLDLPAAHRAAVLLAFYGGLTYRQVAQTLQIPEGTAKSRLRNALRRVADRLAMEGILEA